MTVRQQAEQVFSIEQSVLATYVRSVLVSNKEYRLSTEKERDTLFIVNVKPYIPILDLLLLGTKMTITLHSEGRQTKVTTETKSQIFIMGDAFGMYERYIRDFHLKLQNSMNALS